jgi:hypothetical protein
MSTDTDTSARDGVPTRNSIGALGARVANVPSGTVQGADALQWALHDTRVRRR